MTRLSKYIQNIVTQKFLAYKQVTNCSGDNILIFTINEFKNRQQIFFLKYIYVLKKNH